MTLEQGRAWVESVLDVALQPGGQHPRMGTYNALLRLGSDAYLEVLAVDPEALAPDRPRWFGLDSPASGPRLATWVVRVPDVEAAARRSPWLGRPEAMARDDLAWQLTVRTDGTLPAAGLLPAAITWTTSPPAARLADRGCELLELAGYDAEPDSVRRGLAELGLGEDVLTLPPAAADDPTQLVATIRTPVGRRVLGARDMCSRATTTGVVLAGGRSSRFGSDKLQVDLGGRPLVHHAIAALAGRSSEVLVAVVDSALAPPLPASMPTPGAGRSAPVRIVTDPAPGLGPLAGLLAGLTSATTEFVLVAGGDQPSLASDLLGLLTASIRGADAAVLAEGDRPRPLPCVVRRGPALRAAQARLASEARSLRGLVGDLAPIVVPERTWRRVDPDGRWRRDVDRPEDLSP